MLAGASNLAARVCGGCSDGQTVQFVATPRETSGRVTSTLIALECQYLQDVEMYYPLECDLYGYAVVPQGRITRDSNSG